MRTENLAPSAIDGAADERRQSAAVDPWTEAMRRGDFEAAWRISDAVLRSRAAKPCFHWPRHEQHIWDGRPLDAKRVLVRCYHGLGDTVQFIRYAALLRRRAREVIVWAQPALLPLLRSADGIDALLPLHDGTPDVPYDADVELMELPHVFRTTLATLPGRVPYLHAPTGAIGPVGRGPGFQASGGFGEPASAEANLRVGLVWRSGDWDDRRSIPTRLLERLAVVAGVELVVLQQGAAVAEWPAEWGIVAGSSDVRELAGRMRALDLVISVDSFPAHLAGALGVPTWTLLHSEPDWRWLLGRDDSPWYPTMRLFRQLRAGDWEAVIADVAAELRRRARSGMDGTR